MAEQTVTVGVGALSIEDVIAVARGGAKDFGRIEA